MSQSAERTVNQPRTRDRLRHERLVRAKRMWMLYLFFLVPAVLLFIFRYIPIYGVVIAFQDFRIGRGILGSPFNNFAHFKNFFEGPFFFRLMGNTLVISFLKLGFGFPAPIILALLINELRNMSFKRTIQSISYLPHFMSWVVLAGILIEVISPQRGILGYLYSLFGATAPNLLAEPRLFRGLLVVTEIWKEVGWGTVIYLAAMSGINPELYESAQIDGANRLQRALHVTIPSLARVITILFILRLGDILDAGFDQIFVLYNPLVYEVADIIDTYVYRVGLQQRQLDFSAAVGLFKNVVGVILLLTANVVIKRFSDHGIW